MVQINGGGMRGWRNVEDRGKVQKRNLFTHEKGTGRAWTKQEREERKWKEEE
jgi:hypothetical protein